MKTIPLTQGKVAIVDDADYERLNRHKWCAHKNVNTWYADRKERQGNKYIMVMMHREILNPPSGMQTDHKDGNGLNNQRHNLRIATCSQNQHNGRKRKGTSRFKGVYWNRSHAMWHAHIRVKRKRFHLGYFLYETEAAKAHDQAAQRYFSEFANTNFLKETA